jgi:hypothetical protein
MWRRAVVLCAALAAGQAIAQPACSPKDIGAFHVPPVPCYRIAVSFEAPTHRYPHGVLGDTAEWGELWAELDMQVARLVLPERRVFEDVAPRLADVTGDAGPEIVVVESDAEHGSRLAVYRAAFPAWLGKPQLRLIGATPFIGQRFRWLAPVGAADLDGDGRVEIAYVETPHLGKRLRVWRFEAGALTEIASLPGLTNHRIGDAAISGGLRDCAGHPEMITANADWTRVMATRLDRKTLSAVDVGPLQGPQSFEAALACR